MFFQLAEQSRVLSEEKKELVASVHELSDERILLRNELSVLRHQCKEHEQEVLALRLKFKEHEQETELMQTASSE